MTETSIVMAKLLYKDNLPLSRLLPPELQWGYSDNLILSEKRQVYQAMAH